MITILVYFLYLLWAKFEGEREAYTFAVPLDVESRRRTVSWRHNNVQLLHVVYRGLIGVFLFIIFVQSVSVLSTAFYLWAALIMVGEIFRLGCKNLDNSEQEKSFFAGGRTWEFYLPFRAPNWLIGRYPINNCMKSHAPGWIWEFKEMNGPVKFILLSLLFITFLYLAWI